MAFSDSTSPTTGVDVLPEEQGFALVGSAAQVAAERLFATRLAPGQAVWLSWEPGAPRALIILVTPTRVEIRIPTKEPWPARLRARLAGLAESPGFADRLARAITKLEAWQESEVDAGTSPQELAAELDRLRQLAPSPESRRAIGDALEALDDGLPADAVAAALYRARVGLTDLARRVDQERP